MELHTIDHLPQDQLIDFFEKAWGSRKMVITSGVYDCTELDGFVVFNQAGELAGLITYTLRGQECEITSLNSVEEGKGIGTALIQAVEDAARAHGCSVLKLTTTNDNLKALGFYQKRGFVLSRLLPDAVTRARALKPEIPLIGYAGIPIRDEIELVKHLGDSRETEAVGTK